MVFIILYELGDNWFAQRSTKQAGEICSRRLKQCEETLDKLRKEKTLLEGWINGANNNNQAREVKIKITTINLLLEAESLSKSCASGEGNLEIKEPYDEDKEAEWRIAHQERVKVLRENEKSKRDKGMLNDSWKQTPAQIIWNLWGITWIILGRVQY